MIDILRITNTKKKGDYMEFNQYNEEQDTEQSRSEKRKSSRFPYLISGLVGGVISALLIVLLFSTNVFSINNNEVTQAEPSIKQTQDTRKIANMTAEDEVNPTNIDEVTKSVVGIVNIQQRDIWSPNEEVGAGSGIVYKKENGKAYVITNNHVVEGAEEVEVDLNNEKRIHAKVLGTDPLTDLAVLEMDDSEIEHVATFGSSDDLLVGETVLAIGNPLGMDFSGSVTKGIISGLNRSVKVDTTGNNQPDWIAEVIQTDAAINPGNSGGALVNTSGHVIGINSMKIARSAVEGIGFAIPIDAAIPIIEQLETDGEVTRPVIGISTAELHQVPQEYQDKISLPEDVDNGMVIASVQSGTAAAEAGLQQFDVITKINGEEIHSTLDLRRYIYSETAIGDTIEMEIYRNGKAENIKLRLNESI